MPKVIAVQSQPTRFETRNYFFFLSLCFLAWSINSFAESSMSKERKYPAIRISKEWESATHSHALQKIMVSYNETHDPFACPSLGTMVDPQDLNSRTSPSLVPQCDHPSSLQMDNGFFLQPWIVERNIQLIHNLRKCLRSNSRLWNFMSHSHFRFPFT